MAAPVTPRVKALEEQGREFQATLDALEDALFALDKRLVVLEIHEARCFGIARCSNGELGIVTGWRRVTAPGRIWLAYAGWKLRWGWPRRWSSRTPEWIVGPTWL